jgi:hypothetical protein
MARSQEKQALQKQLNTTTSQLGTAQKVWDKLALPIDLHVFRPSPHFKIIKFFLICCPVPAACLQHIASGMCRLLSEGDLCLGYSEAVDALVECLCNPN